MLPKLILLFCFLGILYLLRNESKSRSTSPALWIPLIWLLILSSRPLSSWIGAGRSGYADIATDYLEGNAIDRYVMFALIAAGLFILSRRRVDWSTFVSSNKYLLLIYLYFLVSAVWADYPVVVGKRWIKDFGNVVVALVVLTEADPARAIRSLYLRCAYILFPLSFVFVKYFPEIGRHYSQRSGELMCTGVTHQKNSLAMLVVWSGLIILWDMIEARKQKIRSMFGAERVAKVVMLGVGIWLLYKSRSATGLVCAIIGITFLFSLRIPAFQRNPRSLVAYAGLGIAVCVIAEVAFNISGVVLEMLGRDPTLTGRTNIWRLVSAQQSNPLLGMGFNSFWSSDAGQAVWDERGDPLISAHNGYLEVYLNGGFVGVGLLFLMIFSVMKGRYAELQYGGHLAALRFMFLGIVIIRNVSESNYFKSSSTWFVFLLMALVAPPVREYVAVHVRQTPRMNPLSSKEAAI